MGSKKPSARARQVDKFKSELGDGSGDIFAQEEARQKQAEEQREAERRHKSCETKKRYRTRDDAQEAIAACARHGTKGLSCYQCPYCKGWHLTSHPWE